MTREERRQRSRRVMAILTYLCFLVFLLVWLAGFLSLTATAEQADAVIPRPAESGSLPGDDTPALVRCYLTEEETDALIRESILESANRMEDAVITFYCCEKRPHICGTGSGVTASGRTAIPYVSCAVDTDIIPLGSSVMVELDGEIVSLRADDTGSGVRGNHIDIAVQSHQEALDLGRRTAAVWWCGS